MTPNDFLSFLETFDKTIAPGLGRDAQSARHLLTAAFANKLGEDNMFTLISRKEHYSAAVKMASWIKSPSRDFLVNLASLGWSNINLYLKDNQEFSKYEDVARLIRLREVIDDRYADLIDYAPYTDVELLSVYRWRATDLEHVMNKVTQEQLIMLAKTNPAPTTDFSIEFVVKYRGLLSSDSLSSLDARLPTLLSLLEDAGSSHSTMVEQLASLLQTTTKEALLLPPNMDLSA